MNRLSQVLLFGIWLVNTAVYANLLPVRPYTIKLESSYQQTNTFLGKTVSERVSDISFERGGLVTQLKVNDGSRVNKDDVLASLDTQLLQERQKQFKAQKQGVEARLALSKKELGRLSELREDGHVSQQAFDREDTNSQNLSSQLMAVSAQLASVALDIQKSVLKAPFDGTVLRRYVHQGVTVQAGLRVLRLQESQIDEVHIGVSQQFLPNLKVGSCYPIVIEKQTYQGCIDHLIRQLSVKTQTVRVIFTLPVQGQLLSGQVAKLKLSKSIQQNGAWVPLDALAQGMRGTWVVYQLETESNNAKLAKIRSQQVEVIYTKGNRAFIRSSLKNGEQVIAAGLHKYAPNQVVELKPQFEDK